MRAAFAFGAWGRNGCVDRRSVAFPRTRREGSAGLVGSYTSRDRSQRGPFFALDCALRKARQRVQRPGHGPATNGQAAGPKAKPNAKQDDAPDEPDADAQERMARLRQLADDYAAAFHRKPNPEDYKMARKLREMSRPDALLPATELIPERGTLKNGASGVREIPDRSIRVSGKAINAALKSTRFVGTARRGSG